MVGRASGMGAAQRLRWIAHGLGSLVAGLWLFAGLMAAFTGADPWTAESTVLVTLIIAGILAVAAAWWPDRAGGMLVPVVGVAHSVFAWGAAGRNKPFAVAITGDPLLSVGALFFPSWRFDKEAADA